jgi:alkylation response protein AidB-like acyl-CoA dehydrogenase
MSDRSFLDWPFFAPSHRSLAESLEPWCEQHLSHSGEHHDTDATCRALVRALGRGGWLRYCVPAAWGGAYPSLKPLGGEALLARAGIAPERRAETLSIAEFDGLARLL